LKKTLTDHHLRLDKVWDATEQMSVHLVSDFSTAVNSHNSMTLCTDHTQLQPVFFVDHLILVIAFIQSTKIRNHFYFILVENVILVSFSFSRR